MSTTIVGAKMVAAIYLKTDGSADGKREKKIDLFWVFLFSEFFVF